MPPELTTFLISMTPVGELRAGIPWGITIGGVYPCAAFIWAVLGNIFAAILVILLLEPLSHFARRHAPVFDRLLQRIFNHTRKTHSRSFERFEEILLILIVAVPLPGSGAYTGALVAWLFGVKTKVAIALISLGIIIAGLIVLGLTTGALAFAKSF
ncbi:MAG: small multi-drug export protein [Patescibacteria group bacterium]